MTGLTEHHSTSPKGTTMAGNDLGSLLGGLLGGGQQGAGSGGGANILGALISALGNRNGAAGGSPLGGLVDMLAKSGLADHAQSWIGTGANQPVSGVQIAEAVPEATLQKVAQDAGVTPQQAADQIAQVLPQTVDKLTPDGAVPPAGQSIEDLIRQQQL
ncbi:YidB family protein [Streptomyces sp. NPDC058685]|uniref:YidB family protein n=1 Tax=Streptomyces sp. NPDC058685 TaxID=3346598 RepID=UPI00364F1745